MRHSFASFVGRRTLREGVEDVLNTFHAAPLEWGRHAILADLADDGGDAAIASLTRMAAAANGVEYGLPAPNMTAAEAAWEQVTAAARDDGWEVSPNTANTGRYPGQPKHIVSHVRLQRDDPKTGDYQQYAVTVNLQRPTPGFGEPQTTLRGYEGMKQVPWERLPPWVRRVGMAFHCLVEIRAKVMGGGKGFTVGMGGEHDDRYGIGLGWDGRDWRAAGFSDPQRLADSFLAGAMPPVGLRDLRRVRHEQVVYYFSTPEPLDMPTRELVRVGPSGRLFMLTDEQVTEASASAARGLRTALASFWRRLWRAKGHTPPGPDFMLTDEQVAELVRSA